MIQYNYLLCCLGVWLYINFIRQCSKKNVVQVISVQIIDLSFNFNVSGHNCNISKICWWIQAIVYVLWFLVRITWFMYRFWQNCVFVIHLQWNCISLNKTLKILLFLLKIIVFKQNEFFCVMGVLWCVPAPSPHLPRTFPAPSPHLFSHFFELGAQFHQNVVFWWNFNEIHWFCMILLFLCVICVICCESVRKRHLV